MSSRILPAACVLAAVFAVQQAAGQDIPLDIFAPLAAKATEHAEITIDSNVLQWAASFMNGTDPNEAKVKKLLAGLKGIYIRTYTFAKSGEYSAADVDRVRSRLKGWSQVVNVHESGEDTGIYLKTDGEKVLGLVVVAAEPMELTLINIVGSIQPDQIKDLSGKFGIPDLGDLGRKATEPKSRPKKQEE